MGYIKKAVVFVALAILMSAGCAKSLLPTAPSDLNVSDPTGQSIGSNHVLWGMWHILIDSASLKADIVPFRGAMFTCNVTQFMQPPSSPTNMISLAFPPGGDPASGHFLVDVTLRHPFTGMRFYNGFDVRGVFISNGTVAGQHDPSVLMAGPGGSILLNADGYTRFWNPTEFMSYNTIFGFTSGKLAPPIKPTSTVNPYKYFADGLGVEDAVETLDTSSRGVFLAGNANTRRYDIQFKMDPGVIFDFNYAVDASWAAPDTSFAPDYPPEAFPADASVAEAYHMVASDAGSTAWYISPTNKGGEFKFDLEVFDRQASFNPSGVPGEVSAIWLESSAMTSPVDVLSSATILPGSTDASSVFEVSIGSLNLTDSGNVDFLATVESKSPNTYKPNLPAGDSFIYPDAPLAAYFSFAGTVLNTTSQQIEVLDPNGGEILSVGGSHEITWDPGDVTGTVFIEYSKDDFVSDINSIATDEANDGSYIWSNIPDDPTTSAKVRISSTDNPSINDVSDGPFSIVQPSWPTDPVLIDPDHTSTATRFAIDTNGVVHALYTDGQNVWWSYSSDYGWTWTNVDTPAYTAPSGKEVSPWNIAMDASGNYVYAVVNQRDQNGVGTTSYLVGLRLDITDESAGWSNITIWTLPGYYIYQNIEGSQLSVADDGTIMVFAVRWEPADYQTSYTYASSWEALENSTPLSFDSNLENGYQTYIYLRWTIQMVHDSTGNFYLTIGGNFNDYNSLNGYDTDWGNAIVKYDPVTGRWRFIQTNHHDGSEHYWLTETRGLAIDSNDMLHWVFEYAYNWPTSSCAGYPCWTCYGDWNLVYGTGPAGEDHNGMTYADPIIDPTFHRSVLDTEQYDCAYRNNAWIFSSIGVTPDGNHVVITYQDSYNNPQVYAIRSDFGGPWSEPELIEGPWLYADSPWGRMHPDGWFLLTFSDIGPNGIGGSKLPYFVAWQ